MYVLPLALILLIALAIFFSPILAAILFVVALIGIGFYKFLGPGTEPEHAPRQNKANAPGGIQGTGRSDSEEDEKTGPWGETWPEESR